MTKPLLATKAAMRYPHTRLSHTPSVFFLVATQNTTRHQEEHKVTCFDANHLSDFVTQRSHEVLTIQGCSADEIREGTHEGVSHKRQGEAAHFMRRCVTYDMAIKRRKGHQRLLYSHDTGAIVKPRVLHTIKHAHSHSNHYTWDE